jgi:hypothetical protein
MCRRYSMGKVNSRVISNEPVSMRLDLVSVLLDAFTDFTETGANNYQVSLGQKFNLTFRTEPNIYSPDYPDYILTIADEAGKTFEVDFDYQDIERTVDIILDGYENYRKV